MRRSLLIALAGFLLACPSTDDDDSVVGDDDDAVAPCGSATGVDPGLAEIRYDAGNPDSHIVEMGWSVYGIDLVEVPLHEGVSFELEHPAIVRAITVHFAQLPEGDPDTPVSIGLFEDFGYNGFDYTWWDPTWEGDLCLGDVGTEGWATYIPDEEVRFEAGLLHVAHLREGADDVAWAIDTSVSEDCGPENDCHSSVHLPEHTEGAQYYAWNGLSFPISQHYLVRLQVEYVDQVPDGERHFQPVADPPRSIRASFGDYDGDGDDDLLLAGPTLLRNDGGTFVDANGASGLAAMSSVEGEGGVFGDYDNDGCLDLFVFKGSTLRGDSLLHNECDGTFTDVTVTSGIADNQAYSDCSEFNFPTFSATWWDIDSDGWLDLYVANRECFADSVYYYDHIWHNEGDGTFTDWTGSNGFLGYDDAPTPSISSAAADADGDGDADLYVSNFRLQPNLYYRNDGGGLVTEMASTLGIHGEPVEFGSSTYYGQSRSATWADIDTDGDFDLVQANLAHQRFYDFSDKTQVFLNDGTGNFGDAQGSWGTPWSNLGIRYIERPWTPVLQDFDSDGALDLMISGARGQPTDFYWGRGEGTYIWDSYAAGITPHDAALAAADIDQDGDVDVVTGDRIYANTVAQGGWASVGVIGNVAANRSAIGATLRAYVGDDVLLRAVSGGNGQQDSLYQHLGLGEASEVDRFEVDFPGGGTVSYQGPFAGGQRWWLFEDGTTEAGWAPPTDR